MNRLTSHFDRLVITIIIVLALGLAAAALAANLLGLRPPELVREEVGERGPVGIRFSQAMRAESVQQRWHSDPPVEGRFNWEGQTMWFWPARALAPGTQVTFRLDSGAEAEDGQVIRQETSWVVKIRSPQIIYLSPTVGSSEIWRIDQDGKNAIQITNTGGKVYDFSPGLDGQTIVYSIENSQQGNDLHTIDRDGENDRQVLACGGDSCIQPVLSLDGKTIAYSRRRMSVSQGETYSPNPRIWTLDLPSGNTTPLFQDPMISGEDPSWSPDGSRLAFFDQSAHVIHVLDTISGKDLLLSSQLGVVGAWTADGSQLWYGDLVSSETLPFGSDYKVDLNTDQVDSLFSQLQTQEDLGVPVPNPDGSWVVVSLRYHNGSYSTQLELMRPDGSEKIAITDEYTYTHGAYSWDPRGTQILYQRFRIGSSAARPEIWIWNQANATARMIAADAALPAWLP